ncbi:MAG: ABC transporter substrate-binding protein, partial [Pseudomonadota bacterium]|nr:ABC transporter substrate-binding protein [Pseudomonadota bacterium]
MKTAMKAWGRQTVAALALCGLGDIGQAADLVIGQVAPLSGVLASTGHQMVVGG